MVEGSVKDADDLRALVVDYRIGLFVPEDGDGEPEMLVSFCPDVGVFCLHACVINEGKVLTFLCNLALYANRGP